MSGASLKASLPRFVARLELMLACLLAEQVDVYNVLSSEHTELSIDKFRWVDSSATLCWIRNEKPKFIHDQIKLNNCLLKFYFLQLLGITLKALSQRLW